jgi:ankyrin repeat protein
LLSQNVDVNAADFKGESALMKACSGYDTQIVRNLLKHNANVNQKNKEGKTALFYGTYVYLNYFYFILIILLIISAVMHGRLDIFNILVRENDENINETDNEGRTPLIWGKIFMFFTIDYI